MVSLALIHETHMLSTVCVCGNDRDAKLSVLDWDDNAHTIHTSSLHYFEGDPSLRMGRTVFPMGPKVVTDPQVGVTVLSSTTHRFIKSLTQLCCWCLRLHSDMILLSVDLQSS